MRSPLFSATAIILIVALLLGAFMFQEMVNETTISRIEPQPGEVEIRWNDREGVSERNLKNVAVASAEFGIELLSNLSVSKEGNILLSPLSIWLAMAMLYEGANGSTAEEIARVLHFPENKSLLRENINWFLENFGNHTENYTLKIANSLWVQEGFPVKERYIEILKEFYYAYFQLLDFRGAPEKARDIINGWIENETNGKIKNFFSPESITPATVAVLVNAIYFHGFWSYQFNESLTKKEPFYSSSGKIMVDMMHISEEFKYTEDHDTQVLEMPYKGGNFSMVIVLPKKSTLNISLKNLEKWRRELHLVKANVSFPKFKLDEKFSVKDILEGMGIREVFNPSADLSDMGPGGIFASDVFHETYISVDEKGTEAAAVTGIPIYSAIPPPLPHVEFRVDHPFLFIIEDRSTGAIFFMGWVDEPAACSG